MKNIIASFRLDTHEKEFRHFSSLFGSRYTYRISVFAGIRVIDVLE